ncbi:TetR/AcrR family transcriptional regulator [Sphingobacterium psychroaquaticum]|uniref:Transcriptional regulator, TetR family n=1 Tax=Sphingobacterium psychroaquaticum TaxID=561061 RepID=A0A1X7ID54_9SPHI|nr:TetR family transcriptional regulator [Sphingobacterium psychroaquaticum]QBQ41655.1 TetR/AcrR family transcriptional regulator [Sphingobacterium psychroaquaticum]SMG12487.1 transcriptional regulator, TetR family [Sphingobacterium psychroaquaticum]
MNQKQLEILEIAESLFAKNGFEGTSVRDIAQAAGINVAMINYYFESKTNLLELIVKRAAESYKMRPEEYNEEVDSFKRLDKMIEHYVNSKINNKDVYQLLFTEATIKKRIINSTVFKELRKHNIQLIKEVIDYGHARGDFRYYDPLLINSTMIGTLMNFRMNRSLYEELLILKPDEDFDDMQKELLRTHLKFTIKAILTHENK